MDIIKNYSAKIPYVIAEKTTGESEVRYAAGDEYRKMIEELESKRGIDPDTKRCNGSTARASLTDTEIAVLANKYDVRDMSDSEFDSLLDDLESMGAVSAYEKRLLGYKGLLEFPGLGDPQDGVLKMYAWMGPTNSAGSAPLFDRSESDGDVLRWINDRIQWQLGGRSDGTAQRREAEAREELHKVLAGIINRMDTRQQSDAEDAKKAALVRELADRNSEFYTHMRTTLKAQVEKTREDEEQQAIIDALGAVLDAMSGKKDVSGNKESVNKSAAALTRKIGERIARLKREDPDNPEIAKLESILKRLQEMGIYFDLGDTDDLWQSDDTFETLTQLLTRRQAEERSTAHPTEKR